MSKTAALIQARMSSRRFPGKVLESLGGLPMIVFMARRVRRAETLGEVAVVTSEDPSDDPLAAVLAKHGIPCFRGDLHDVLSRYVAAAAAHEATEIVRLTGDCPLADPAVIDSVVRVRRESDADYASNIEPRTFPDGLDVECFTRATLASAARRAMAPLEREHVTPWMRAAGNGLRRSGVSTIVDCSQLRLTVDYPADLAAIRRLVELVDRAPDAFDMFDVLRCLDRHPEIIEMNASAGRLETT